MQPWKESEERFRVFLRFKALFHVTSEHLLVFLI